jgi:hypothetical protein
MGKRDFAKNVVEFIFLRIPLARAFYVLQDSENIP